MALRSRAKKAAARKAPAKKAEPPKKPDHTKEIARLLIEWTESKHGATRLAIEAKVKALKAEMDG